jgi:hypothetical protein
MFEGDISQGEPKSEVLQRKEFVANEKIRVVMESDTHSLSFDKFCEKAPRGSIALDGIVKGVTQFNENGPWMNIDHHSEKTKSTAAQIEDFILKNQLGAFEKDGKISANLYVNHCDEDVCLSLFLLKYAHIPEIINHEKMQRLVKINDNLDIAGGMYPYAADSPDLKEVTWVMEPYQQFMLNKGTTGKYSSDEDRNTAYLGVVGQVEERIISYLTGEAEAKIREYKPKTEFEKIEHDHEDQWTFVKNLEAQGRTKMARDKIPAYVYLKNYDEKARKYYYSIGKLSESVDYFDLPKFYELLNGAEAAKVTDPNNIKNDTNKWGGSTIVGGSPPLGSVLSPEEIIKIINQYIDEKKSIVAS